ncbi:methylthioadenosine phosphorylase [Phaffia rhodozyma]|uniref:S-methyl-5'-thioadenosine phosphorylase n=1 Tax=Phaffia rhodozyma TaxID=264483 RepID=A0A0F7SW25_PHARH|nr:methylthioadenosine phosphorylase [Phaffia rhodozyma]
MSSSAPVTVGVIGGSGLYQLDNLTFVREINVETPWGSPSSPISVFSLPSDPSNPGQPGSEIAFISRHGKAHNITPTEVPSRANIAALKSIGVQAIVAFSAVGSLREEIAPGDFIIPSQIIDRTKGIRPSTFFTGLGVVVHAMFGDPFDNQLVKHITPLVKSVLSTASESGGEVKVHEDKTVVVMEGPQFSTRAESLMYRQWGGDIINMSSIPEAKLAREAEIPYALICTSTDYDAWRAGEAPVTVEEVIKTLHTNAHLSKKVAEVILPEVVKAVQAGDVLTETKGCMKFSCITRKDGWSQEAKEKLSWVLDYFKEE